MIRCFLLIFSFFFTSIVAIDQNAEYRIVFVHLGSKLPSYVPISLKQAKLFNPDAELILIANRKALNAMDFKLDGLTLIAVETIPQSIEHREFTKKSKLDKRWRQGFWFYTTERLYYLDDLITQYDLKSTFHMENDNLIYVNLADLLPIFVECYSGIAAPFESDDRGAASFIYVANKESIHTLSQYILDNVTSKKSDMLLINDFKNTYSPTYIDHLPTLMRDYSKDRELVSLLGKKSKLDPERYCNNVDRFQSLFDACTYGQFFGGIDPRNGFEGPGYLNLEAVFNCSHMVMEWQIDSLGRKVPFACYGDKKYRINNLHIHSKDLQSHASFK